MTRPGFLYFLAIILLVVAGGCSDSGKFRGFPCRLKGEEKWSLISMNGRLLAEECSVHRPTPVSCDRFWAQNDNGYWQLYSVESPEKPLTDKEYRYVTNFHDGRALVAERDKPVSIIDLSGDESQSLETLDGRTPGKFLNIADGMAVYTADSLQGLIGFDGCQILKPEFHAINTPACGRVIATDRNGAAFYSSTPDSVAESTAIVFDYSGRECFRISSRSYGRMAESFVGDYLPVARVSGSQEMWGLLDKDGKPVVEPDSINRDITDIAAGNYVFMDSSGLFGVRSIKDGTIIVKPRYTSATFLGEKHLAVAEPDKTGERVRYSIINLKGEKTVGRSFAALSPLFGDKLFGCVEEGRWVIMDLRGEMSRDLPEIEDVSYTPEEPSRFVMSDFIDVARLISQAGISPVGVGSMTFASTARGLLDLQARELDFVTAPVAANYCNTDEINFFPTVEGEMLAVTVTFPAALSRPVVKTRSVLDYIRDVFRTPKHTVPEYEFTDTPPSRFSVMFNNYGKLRGKLRRVYGALVEHFGAFGKVVDSNSGATFIDLGNNRHALVSIEENSVKAQWGQIPESDRSVLPYEGNKEKLAIIFAEETYGYGGEIK